MRCGLAQSQRKRCGESGRLGGFKVATGGVRLTVTQTEQNKFGTFLSKKPSGPQSSSVQNTIFDRESTRPTKPPPQDIISSILALKPVLCWKRNLYQKPVQLLRVLFLPVPAVFMARMIDVPARYLDYT